MNPRALVSGRGIPDAPSGLVAPAGVRAAPAAWAMAALVRRDLAERRLLRLPLLLDLVFGVVNLVVFLFISRVLTGPDGTRFGHSATYFDFVAVGITFMLVIQAAGTQLTGRIGQEQRAGTLELLVSQPVPVWALAVGLSAYPFLFALLRAGIYLGVLGGALGLRVGRADWVGVVLILLLGSAAMMALGIGLMAFTVALGHGDAAARLVVVALSFVSGTYFPIAALPPVLREAGRVLPTRTALDGLRHALSGDGWADSAVILLGSGIILLPLSIWIFDRALRLARHRGTLTRD